MGSLAVMKLIIVPKPPTQGFNFCPSCGDEYLTQISRGVKNTLVWCSTCTATWTYIYEDEDEETNEHQ